MPIRRDIATDFDTQDLLFKNNDFYFHDSDSIHIRDTVEASPGWWKAWPTDGCDIIKYLNAPEEQFRFLARNIIINLTYDGYDVSNPIITYDNQGKLNINPNATII